MTRDLVVVAQADDLKGAARTIAARIGADPTASFHVIVPAATSGHGWETEGADRAAAEARLAAFLADLTADGVRDVTGAVSDADVLIAVEDALRTDTFDAIVIASPPQRVASVFGEDLAERVERAFALPVVSVVDPDARTRVGRSLGFGVTSTDQGDRADTDSDSTERHVVRVRWLTAVAVLAVVVSATVLVTVTVHNGSSSASGSVGTGPAALTVAVGGPEDHGATQELTGYYPATIEAHPGDTLSFHNGTVDVPHTVSFGVARNRSNQPTFGRGRPNLAIVQPCTDTQKLALDTSHCEPGPLPAFDGQAFYSSGVIAPGTTFVLQLANDLAPGGYSFDCLIHPAQHGTLLVVPREVAIQSSAQLRHAGETELAKDRADIGGLLTQRVVPAAGVTVQAGLTVGEVSVNAYFPKTVTIKVGQTVTWENPTPTPHLVMVDGGLAPDVALFASPKPASGSDYSSGFANSGPIGIPPYPTSTYSLRFTKPGTYTVVCTFHPGMTGSIIVTP